MVGLKDSYQAIVLLCLQLQVDYALLQKEPPVH